jgi:hypothetical protein
VGGLGGRNLFIGRHFHSRGSAEGRSPTRNDAGTGRRRFAAIPFILLSKTDSECTYQSRSRQSVEFVEDQGPGAKALARLLLGGEPFDLLFRAVRLVR